MGHMHFQFPAVQFQYTPVIPQLAASLSLSLFICMALVVVRVSEKDSDTCIQSLSCPQHALCLQVGHLIPLVPSFPIT